MNAHDLELLITSLTQDINFSYHNIEGAICPFSLRDISVSYGDDEHTFSSVKDVMDTPFVAGRPLRDICQKLEIG